MKTEVVLSLLCVLFSLVVVFGKGPIGPNFFLVLSTFIIGAVYYSVGSLFMGIVQIILVVSLVFVLYFFSLMLIDLSVNEMKNFYKKMSFGLGSLSTLTILLILVFLVSSNDVLLKTEPIKFSISELYSRIYGEHFVALELITLIVLGVILTTVSINCEQRKDVGK